MGVMRTILAGLVLVAGVAVGLTTAACAPKPVQVAAPPPVLIGLAASPDGSAGGITVSNDAGSVDIDTASHFTAVGGATTAPAPPAPMADADITRVFGRALAVRPLAPVHFVLHFASDATDLTPESAGRLDEIVAAIRDRVSEVVSVVGHSDTSGNAAYNVALSTRRAEAVRDLLVARGVAVASIQVTSHGETNPLVPTGDNVKEERNRRVEVVVR